MSFAENVMRIAQEKFQAREISRGDLLRVRLAMAIPRVRRQLEEECRSHLVMTGEIDNVEAAIDPETLRAIFEVILEFIKALMSLFS